jgi:hypothetical protein
MSIFSQECIRNCLVETTNVQLRRFVIWIAPFTCPHNSSDLEIFFRDRAANDEIADKSTTDPSIS